MNWSEVGSVLFGAVLALATTFVTKLFAEWYETRKKCLHLERFLVVELPGCVSRVGSLWRIYERSQEPDPDFLSALEHAIDRFAKQRETAYSLKMGQQVLEFYDGVEHAIEMILSMLRLAQEPKYVDYASEWIQKQMLRLKELHTVGEDLMEEFKKGAEKVQTFERRLERR